MAKASMRPEVKAAKLKNNKVGMLICSVPKCETEYYISRHNPAKRKCEAHFVETTTGVKLKNKREKSLLFKLGLIS